MLSNVTKNCDENLMVWNTSNGKTLLFAVNMSLMFKFSWEILFFERGDTEPFKAARNKLFARCLLGTCT